jgi:hypothetical protein
LPWCSPRTRIRPRTRRARHGRNRVARDTGGRRAAGDPSPGARPAHGDPQEVW